MDALLKPTLAATHVAALLTHHETMIKEFQQGAWEESIGKGGKFIEAVLKALWIHTGNTLPPARQFKADNVINQLAKQSTFDDSVRLTIPRACRFAYDIASNRGARHDPTEINPNEMDANAVVAVTSWILGEMVRYAQKGTLKPDEVKALVDGLAEKKYPLMEHVEGRTYFHVPGASAAVLLSCCCGSDTRSVSTGCCSRTPWRAMVLRRRMPLLPLTGCEARWMWTQADCACFNPASERPKRCSPRRRRTQQQGRGLRVGESVADVRQCVASSYRRVRRRDLNCQKRSASATAVLPKTGWIASRRRPPQLQVPLAARPRNHLGRQPPPSIDPGPLRADGRLAGRA
jgi:hypothetical protein